jgi:hypothetical protein
MKRAILSTLLIAATAATTQGALVLNERFNYPDGNIVGAINSPWQTTSAGTPMECTNNMLVVTTSRAEDVNALLAGVSSFTAASPYNTNSSAVLYSKFQIYFTGFPTAAGTYFAHFKDNQSGAATGFGARIWASTTNAVSGGLLTAGKLRLGIANGPNASVTSGQWDTDLTTNVVYTVVTRFVPATGLSTLWINPTAETDASVTATDGDKLPDRPIAMDVYAYGFRQASGEGTIWIDNLKIATSFDGLSAPGISFIADQNISANTATPAIPFTVTDDETPATSLTVTGSSSDTTLIPNGNIVFGGSATNRTVTVTPAPGKQGTAAITVNCTDTDNKTTSISFLVRVGAPVISTIADIETMINTPAAPGSFTVGDGESAASTLTLTGTSSNPGLVPDANIVFGGGASNRTVTVTPTAGITGLSTITVVVSDGVNTNSTQFVVTVAPALGLVLSDDFNYPDGALYDGQNLSPWARTSGTTADVKVTNNVAILSQDLQEDVASALTSAPFDTTTGWILYSGFTVTFTALPSSTGDYFTHLRDTGTTFRAKVFGLTSGAASGKFRLGIANQGNIPSAVFPQDLNLNQEYQVVTKYNVGSGVATLWINPATAASSHVTATDQPGPNLIATFSLRESGGIGTNMVDNLRVSTSFADVVTLTPPATPDSIPLNIAVLGSSVRLSWTNSAFKLQSATSVAGPYSDVLGAASPYTTSMTGTQKYFRLKY